jgi:hypothetical protein
MRVDGRRDDRRGLAPVGGHLGPAHRRHGMGERHGPRRVGPRDQRPPHGTLPAAALPASGRLDGRQQPPPGHQVRGELHERHEVPHAHPEHEPVLVAQAGEAERRVRVTDDRRYPPRGEPAAR